MRGRIKEGRQWGRSWELRKKRLPIKYLIYCSPNGITIEIGVENVAEDLIPTKGNIVTYTYDHLTKAGIPVNPRITRIRTDLFWEDVLRDYESNSLFAQGTLLLSPLHRLIFNEIIEVQHPSKNIKMNELEREHKWRELFQQIARDRNLDPLVPGTWYSLSRGEIEKVKVVTTTE